MLQRIPYRSSILKQCCASVALTLGLFCLWGPAYAESGEHSQPPTYELDNSVVSINQVLARAAPPVPTLDNLMFEAFPIVGAIGRGFERLTPDQLRTLPQTGPEANPVCPQILERGDEPFFDLWAIATDRPERSKAIVEFAIRNSEAGTAYLLIGCDYMVVVRVDGKTIYGRRGYLQYQQASDVVPIELRKGVTSIALEFFIKEPRGCDGANPPWFVSIEATTSSSTARAVHLRSNRHGLDTSLVRSLADIRTLSAPPICSSISLRDGNGKEQAFGTIAANYEVRWASVTANPTGTYQVYIDGEIRDYLIVYGDSEVDALAQSIPNGDIVSSVDDAWAFRVRHLLRSEFVSQRNSQEWAQKLALASGQRLDSNRGVKPIHGMMSLGAFRSSFDDSVQFFQYYIPNGWGELTSPPPVIVFVPGVANPIRPFLQSRTLADLREFENWCSVADETGCSLLWPGYSDLDYGGALSSRFLTENLEAFAAHIRDDRIRYVLVGICSAGVAASRAPLLTQANVCGVVLWSPELLRKSSRYTPGIDGDYVENTFEPETSQNLVRVAAGLAGMRLAVVRDSALIGHGNMDQLDSLLKILPRGSRITEFVYPTGTGYVWGARMKSRLRDVLGWAQGTSQYSTVRPPIDKPCTPSTVVEKLANGFTLREIPPSLSAWFSRWNERYLVWRGVPLPRKPIYSKTTVCIVGREIASGEELPNFLPLDVVARMNGNRNPVFGIASSGNTEIVVFARGCDGQNLPDIDPLLDGVFAGIMLEYADQTWKSVAVW